MDYSVLKIKRKDFYILQRTELKTIITNMKEDILMTFNQYMLLLK